MEENESGGVAEDRVILRDNYSIVMWKTQELIHNPVENSVSICCFSPFTHYFALSSAEVQERL